MITSSVCLVPAVAGGRVQKRVLIVGQGYVGLPIAMRAVEVGYAVTGLDKDRNRVERLRLGDSFVEDVSAETLRAALVSGRYEIAADISEVNGYDIAVITVPTPLRETVPDLTFIEDAAAALAPLLGPGALVILESTTYPGTTEELMIPILEERSGLKAGPDFMVGYSPERIDPGNKTWKFENTPKVVSGIDEASKEAVTDFYLSLVGQVVPVSSCKEAELTKLLENTFRHVNVALVNELAVFANQLGIDLWEAIDAASTKPFGYMRFTPLSADRSELPLLEGAHHAGQQLSLRGASQRCERPHAFVRGESSGRGTQPLQEGRQWLASSPSGHRLQEELRRRPRVAGDPSG
jgi:UDP-N-acetyl-D-glucosamine dehydrogenase